ncbi:hypothetical protein Taro_009837 [Colocasia esculenta]|uniref:Uncharacterized protein n=1 Tax=Colocasia esculenta TaxID=4460 RepID=A0A843U6T8_COLES|nr:hypothetical protein [Colocasia esculenta]
MKIGPTTATRTTAAAMRTTMVAATRTQTDVSTEFNNELGSFGGRLELLRRRRKAGNPELHPLHPLLRPERRLVLDLHKGPLVSTLLDLVSTHCPKTAQKVFWEGPLVSTLLDLVSTHCPKTAQKVVMRNQRSQMGQGKSDEHPSYE